MKHEVGSIVFLLDNGEMKVFPARVEEEIVRRRVGSEEVSYKVTLPTKERTVVDLSELDVSVFTSAIELRSHMAENAMRTIDSIIERAQNVSRAFDAPKIAPSEAIVQDESR
jgi:hypothetical protein